MVENRDAITGAVQKRVLKHKTIHLGRWDSVKSELFEAFPDLAVFPMGAVLKPNQAVAPNVPLEYRPTSDHTRTGFNAATVMGILQHSLDSFKQAQHLMSRGAYSYVSDVEDAFLYIPLLPAL